MNFLSKMYHQKTGFGFLGHSSGPERVKVSVVSCRDSHVWCEQSRIKCQVSGQVSDDPS